MHEDLSPCNLTDAMYDDDEDDGYDDEDTVQELNFDHDQRGSIYPADMEVDEWLDDGFLELEEEDPLEDELAGIDEDDFYLDIEDDDLPAGEFGEAPETLIPADEAIDIMLEIDGIEPAHLEHRGEAL